MLVISHIVSPLSAFDARIRNFLGLKIKNPPARHFWRWVAKAELESVPRWRRSPCQWTHSNNTSGNKA
jgi:hypothetical protein